MYDDQFCYRKYVKSDWLPPDMIVGKCKNPMPNEVTGSVLCPRCTGWLRVELLFGVSIPCFGSNKADYAS